MSNGSEKIYKSYIVTKGTAEEHSYHYIWACSLRDIYEAFGKDDANPLIQVIEVQLARLHYAHIAFPYTLLHDESEEWRETHA